MPLFHCFFLWQRLHWLADECRRWVRYMDSAVANALKRKEELERELAEIRQFLTLHQKYGGTKSEDAETDWPVAVVKKGDTIIGRVVPHSQPTKMKKVRGAPANFSEIAERVLIDVGRPLTRTELVDEIEKRGVVVPSIDKARYIGTILWRHRNKFENIDGEGYWLKGRERPSAKGRFF